MSIKTHIWHVSTSIKMHYKVWHVSMSIKMNYKVWHVSMSIKMHNIWHGSMPIKMHYNILQVSMSIKMFYNNWHVSMLIKICRSEKAVTKTASCLARYCNISVRSASFVNASKLPLLHISAHARTLTYSFTVTLREHKYAITNDAFKSVCAYSHLWDNDLHCALRLWDNDLHCALRLWDNDLHCALRLWDNDLHCALRLRQWSALCPQTVRQWSELCPQAETMICTVPSLSTNTNNTAMLYFSGVYSGLETNMTALKTRMRAETPLIPHKPSWPCRLPLYCRLFARTAQNRVSVLLCILEVTTSILGPETLHNKNYRGFI